MAANKHQLETLIGSSVFHLPKKDLFSAHERMLVVRRTDIALKTRNSSTHKKKMQNNLEPYFGIGRSMLTMFKGS